MNSLTRLATSLLVFILLALLPFSCRKSTTSIDKLEPPKLTSTDNVEVIVHGSAPEFRTRVYIFDEETTKQIISITRTRIVIKKTAVLTGGRISAVSAANIQPGDIMAGGKTDSTPYGFNRKVTSVRESKDGTELEIDTKDASFEDIFKNASFTIKKTFEYGTSLEGSLGKSTGSNGGVGVEIKTSGSASVLFGLELPIEVKDYSLQKAEAKIVINPKVNMSASVTDKITTGPLETQVFSKTGVIVAIVPVGVVPFPIVITPKIDMALTGEAGLEGSLTFNAIDVNIKGELGAGYEKGRGFYDIATFDKSENKSGTLVGKLKGYLQAGFKTTLSVSLYDFEGVSIGDEAHLYARVEGECNDNEKGKALVKISSGAENKAFAKFDLFGFSGMQTARANLIFGNLQFDVENDLCGSKKGKWLFAAPFTSSRAVYQKDKFHHYEYDMLVTVELLDPCPIRTRYPFSTGAKFNFTSDMGRFEPKEFTANIESDQSIGYVKYILDPGQIDSGNVTVTATLPDGTILTKKIVKGRVIGPEWSCDN